MPRVLNTFGEVDLHTDNLNYMYKQNGFIPVYYQMALITALSKASEGIVLYFFEQLSKKNNKVMSEYFGNPLEIPSTIVKPNTNRVSDLNKLL